MEELILCRMCDGVGTIGTIMKTVCAQCKGTGQYDQKVFTQYSREPFQNHKGYSVSGISIPYVQHYPRTNCSG